MLRPLCLKIHEPLEPRCWSLSWLGEVAGGSRFRVTPAAAPEQPEIKQLQNALLVPPPLNEWVSPSMVGAPVCTQATSQHLSAS